MTTRDDEQVLEGPGAGGGTIRSGDTIRRAVDRLPSGALAVLQHLEAVGFDGAPRYRGVDERGRHVVSFMPGEVALPPLPRWVAADNLLTSLGRLLREYHDAVAGVAWASQDLDWGYAPPPAYRGPVPCHLDVSPANVVCRDGKAVGLIDFEEIALARPVWDVARTARHWVPMLAAEDLVGPWHFVRHRRIARLELFVDAYELARTDRVSLADTMLASADASYERMRTEAAAGNALYMREWSEGHAERNRRGRAWMAAKKAQIQTQIGCK